MPDPLRSYVNWLGDQAKNGHRPLRGFISARVSTDEQNRPGLVSIPDQVARCQAYAARVDVPVDPADVFVDDETGRIVERPGLALALAQLDQYTHAFFYSADRLARRRKVALAIREALGDAGVELRLVLGDTAEMDAESRLWLESIQDTASEAELLRIVRRTTAGRRGRAEQGLTNRAPRCYRILRDARGKSVGYELDPAWRPFLDELARLFLEGLPYSQMAQRLGLNPATQRPWRAGAIKRFAQNPLLRGRLDWGRLSGPVQFSVESAAPAAWDAETCQAIERELARRAARGRAWTRQGKAPLAGVLRCGYCGRNLNGRYLKDRRSRWYGWQYGCTYNRYRLAGTVAEPPHAPNSIMQHLALALIHDLIASLDPAAHIAGLKARNPDPPDSAGSGFAAEQLALVREQAAAVQADLKRLRSEAARRALRAELARLEEQGVALAAEASQRAAALQPDPEDVGAALQALQGRPVPGKDIPAPEARELRALLRRAFPDGVYIAAGQIAPPVSLRQ